MKLIARKDFAKAGEALKDIEIPDAKHAEHIHKGARFEIGTAKEFKGLGKADQVLVAGLVAAGCVWDANDTNMVKAIDEEIAIDKKREQNAAKLNAAADASSLVKQMTDLLQKANAQVK